MEVKTLIGIEEKDVIRNMRKKLKKINKCKDKIDINVLMDCINEKLKDYNILSKTATEIVIKIDKKTNINELEEDIRECIQQQIPNEIDINLLFKFITINNQFIIRLKRKID